MKTPPQAFFELQEILTENRPMPEDIRSWLLSGCNKVAEGRYKSLDEAIGLKAEQGRECLA